MGLVVGLVVGFVVDVVDAGSGAGSNAPGSGVRSSATTTRADEFSVADEPPDSGTEALTEIRTASG